MKIHGDYFLDVPKSATGSMFPLWRRKIYLLFASLLVLVLKSNRGESILRRDVEKRDVDNTVRPREQRRKESQKKKMKEWAMLM